jgi:hypothetical protein
MSSIEIGDRRAILALKQELIDIVSRAHSLAWAIARLEGKSEEPKVSGAIRETVLSLLGDFDATPANNVVNLRKQESRSLEAAPAALEPLPAQDLLLESLRGREASVRDLQVVIEDHNLDISPGNLSVILSRMTQAGLIQRTGRGIYKIA